MHMIRYLTATDCTDEQLEAGAFVVPVPQQQVLDQQAENQRSIYVYSGTDHASFRAYVHLLNRGRATRR